MHVEVQNEASVVDDGVRNSDAGYPEVEILEIGQWLYNLGRGDMPDQHSPPIWMRTRGGTTKYGDEERRQVAEGWARSTVPAQVCDGLGVFGDFIQQIVRVVLVLHDRASVEEAAGKSARFVFEAADRER